MTISPLHSKKKIKFLLLNSLGYLGILTFNFTEKLFKVLSLVNLNILQVSYQPTKNIAVGLKNEIVVCASRNCLLVIPTSKYWKIEIEIKKRNCKKRSNNASGFIFENLAFKNK